MEDVLTPPLMGRGRGGVEKWGGEEKRIENVNFSLFILTNALGLMPSSIQIRNLRPFTITCYLFIVQSTLFT
jgi:hypothetical protein